MSVRTWGLVACAIGCAPAGSHAPPPREPPPPPAIDYTAVELSATDAQVYVGVDPRGHVYCSDLRADSPSGGPECTDFRGTAYSVSTVYDIAGPDRIVASRRPDLEVFEIRGCGNERRPAADPERRLRQIDASLAALPVVSEADLAGVSWRACADRRIALRVRGPLEHRDESGLHVFVVTAEGPASVALAVDGREVHTFALDRLPVSSCGATRVREWWLALACEGDVAAVHSIVTSPTSHDCLQWGPGPQRGSQCAPDRLPGTAELLRVDLASGAVTDLRPPRPT